MRTGGEILHIKGIKIMKKTDADVLLCGAFCLFLIHD